MAFVLHPQLAADCLLVGDLPLSRLLMMNESRYPWFILVPQREGVREMHHLAEADQTQLWTESLWLGATIEALFKPDKLNVAALGNMVPQLHIHHIARFSVDAAWPAPVWGKFVPEPYAAAVSGERLQLLRARMAAKFVG